MRIRNNHRRILVEGASKMRTEKAIDKIQDEIFKEKKYIRNCIQSGNEDKVSGVSGLGDTPRDYSMFLEGMRNALYWVQGKRLVNPIKIEFLYKDDPEMMEWKDPTEESD